MCVLFVCVCVYIHVCVCACVCVCRWVGGRLDLESREFSALDGQLGHSVFGDQSPLKSRTRTNDKYAWWTSVMNLSTLNTSS